MMENPYVNKVIISHASRGDGKSRFSRCRSIKQVFTFEGELIAELDPDSYTLEEVVSIVDKAIAITIAEECTFDEILNKVLK